MDAAVAAGDDVARIGGIDPERVEVTVNSLHAAGREGFAAVFREVHGGAENPDAQIVRRIDAHLAVVGRTRIGVAHFVPGFALVLAAVDPAFFVLHQGVNDVGILAIDIKANAAGFAAAFIGQAFAQFFPADAAIRGLIYGGFAAAAVEDERSAAALVGCSVERVRAFRVHGDVADAGIVRDLEDLRPGFAAVDGFVHPAFGIGSPQMAEGGNVNHVGIFRVHQDASDVARLGKAHVLPGFAAVGRFIDAVTPG